MGLLLVADLGLVDYREAWHLQHRLARGRAQGLFPDLLLLLEHPSVITIGRRGRWDDVLLPPGELARRGVQVVEVDRGGQVTYHGPGQLVGYLILDLRSWGGGPLRFVRTLEQALIDALAQLGVLACREEGLTGVWAGGEKVAAIGVRVSRGVTLHGFALNVDPDLSFFRYIVPCGIRDRGVTSLARLLGRPVDMALVKQAVARSLARRFGLEPSPLDGKALRRLAKEKQEETPVGR